MRRVSSLMQNPPTECRLTVGTIQCNLHVKGVANDLLQVSDISDTSSAYSLKPF